jgi:hypothetical protein
MLVLHGWLDTREKLGSSGVSFNIIPVFVEVQSYLTKIVSLAPMCKFWGAYSGVMVGTGFCCNFVASTTISPAVAFGIAACEPVANLIFGIALGGTLEGADWFVKLLFAVTTALFAVAILLMSFSAA